MQAKQKIKFRLNILWKDNCGIWGKLSEIIIGNYFIGKHNNNVKGGGGCTAFHKGYYKHVNKMKIGTEIKKENN